LGKKSFLAAAPPSKTAGHRAATVEPPPSLTEEDE